MVTHGRYHYGKDRYSYMCDLCQCDMKVDKNDGSWITQEELAEYLGITKNKLGGFLLRSGLKDKKSKATDLALKTSNLFVINISGNAHKVSYLWNKEKIERLYENKE